MTTPAPSAKTAIEFRVHGYTPTDNARARFAQLIQQTVIVLGLPADAVKTIVVADNGSYGAAIREFAPGASQWIPNILTGAGVSGIFVLVWITGLMALGRQFAGPFVHRLSPSGMLVMSAGLSALGLIAMSRANGAMLFAAATVFAFGVCFFWPTMLGYVSENFPKTGALGLAIMGGAGMLSAGYMVPLIGKFYDRGIAARLAAGMDPAAASAEVQTAAGLETLGKVAVVPLVLVVVFIFLFLARCKGNARLRELGENELR